MMNILWCAIGSFIGTYGAHRFNNWRRERRHRRIAAKMMTNARYGKDTNWTEDMPW